MNTIEMLNTEIGREQERYEHLVRIGDTDRQRTSQAEIGRLRRELAVAQPMAAEARQRLAADIDQLRMRLQQR